MRLLLEPRIYIAQKFGGISRYYTEIFSRISKKSEVTVNIPLYYSENIYFNESLLASKNQKRTFFWVNFLKKIGISLRKKIHNKNVKIIQNALRDKQYDLFVPTYYDISLLEHIGSKPFVLTVYDMIDELFPLYFEQQKEIINNKKILIEKATKIIAVSQNTKKDILKIYPEVDASKIEVIYHGNSIKVNHSITLNLPDNYILFVGVRSFYKNFKFFVKSIQELLQADKNLHVVCAGGTIFTPEETEFIESLGLKKQIIHYNFKAEELGMIYHKALCFVFPSEYEGFGIPVLEAMACGCPVILTNSSSFPEVAQDAGIFFENNNEQDLRNKVNAIITNKDLAQQYRDKGLLQAQKFDWDIAAKQCFELYEKAIIKFNKT